MGIYLNPGNSGFWESIRSEIYVDKTGLIAETNAVCCACIYDRYSSCKKVWSAFGTEYVLGVFHD